MHHQLSAICSVVAVVDVANPTNSLPRIVHSLDELNNPSIWCRQLCSCGRPSLTHHCSLIRLRSVWLVDDLRLPYPSRGTPAPEMSRGASEPNVVALIIVFGQRSTSYWSRPGCLVARPPCLHQTSRYHEGLRCSLNRIPVSVPDSSSRHGRSQWVHDTLMRCYPLQHPADPFLIDLFRWSQRPHCYHTAFSSNPSLAVSVPHSQVDPRPRLQWF